MVESPAGSIDCIPAPTYEGDVIWITAHELFEEITDPNLTQGWRDPSTGSTAGYEIADECNSDGIFFNPGQSVNLHGTTYLLPGMWSNFTNSCQFGSYFAQVDPVVTGTLGQNGWYTSNVTLHWDIRPAAPNRRIDYGCVNQSITTDGTSQFFDCGVTGLVPVLLTPFGSQATGDSGGFQVDKTPPVLSPTFSASQPFQRGEAVTASAGASDATSGLASSSCGTVNTSTVGTFSVSCSATDNAGNHTSKSVSYTVAAKQLVKDGGFERPAKGGGGVNFTFSAGHKIGPWSVTAGSVDLASGYWQNAAGVQSIDLAGLAPGTLSQTLNVLANDTYVIRFKYAGNPDCATPTTKQLGVLWNGTQIATRNFSITGHNRTSMGWKGTSITVPSVVAGANTLAFTNLSTGACGATLDSVTVKPA